MTRARFVVVSVCLGASLIGSMASAQTPPAPVATQTSAPRSRVMQTVSLLGGAATGLVAHEGGHIVFGAIFGAHPSIKRLDYGPIRFFRIDHDLVTPKEEFVITSAGFWVQHVGSEWILTAHPDLRHESSPFLKGILGFNLATSAMYATAAFGQFGPDARDTLGIAVSYDDGKGMPEPVVGALILAPAVLDGWRYLHPEATWAKWASRAAKIGMAMLTLR